MENVTEVKPRIRFGRTEMDFPHQGRTLTAVHPFYGPSNSRTLQSLISQAGYKEPTSAELTSFVHEYFSGAEPQAQEVQEIMSNKYFRGFTGILYVPEGNGKGLAHFIDYPTFDENSFVRRDNLLERLGESRAQVSFEHLREGPVSQQKVAKHPYFVAWAGGEDGAEKLAELTSKHSRQEAYVWVPNVSNLKEPIAGVAALYSGWVDLGLDVDSDGHGDDEDSFAFVVLEKDTEGVAQKK